MTSKSALQWCLCAMFVVIGMCMMYCRQQMVQCQLRSSHYKQEALYWRERSLFMEANYAPDATDLFDEAALADIGADVVLEVMNIMPFLGTLSKWGKKLIDRQSLQQLRMEKSWNRIELNESAHN
mmetsp:Transcript_67092/g.106680  ORF Transcript_67092/g.106680 Transcript_67092/m.106680 type:complete len:125 (-) Transcript_67092:119-493(-)